MEVSHVGKGDSNLSIKDSPVYVGMTPHAHRIEEEKSGKEKKNEEGEVGEKLAKQNKNISRKIEDGLLLVVPARIYGKQVKELIDSGQPDVLRLPFALVQ